jgi:hypothetical protein
MIAEVRVGHQSVLWAHPFFESAHLHGQRTFASSVVLWSPKAMPRSEV